MHIFRYSVCETNIFRIEIKKAVTFMAKATVSQRLKEIMELKGLKQVDIIKMSEPYGKEVGIKLGKSHISQYISGKTEPRIDVIAVLAKTLDVSELWLMGEDVDMKSGKKYMPDTIGENGMREFKKSTKLDNVLYDVRGPVVDEAARMEEAGMHILKLNIGNPAPFGFRAPEEVIYDMRQQLTDCEGYSDSRGLFAARKAIMDSNSYISRR